MSKFQPHEGETEMNDVHPMDLLKEERRKAAEARAEIFSSLCKKRDAAIKKAWDDFEWGFHENRLRHVETHYTRGDEPIVPFEPYLTFEM